jgi:6-pyruvoyltetrahydropterin/6-carboxytetrahydropterin synthase
VFTLTKEFLFEASHVLPHHSGKCSRMHGHSWKFAVEIRGGVLRRGGSNHGMLMDYGVISAAVKPIVEDLLDHRHLNDVEGIGYPTSERIAEWLFFKVRDALPADTREMLHAITVNETCTCACRYEQPKEEPADAEQA